MHSLENYFFFVTEEVFEMEDERIYDSPRNASEKYVEDLSTNDLHIYVNSYKK